MKDFLINLFKTFFSKISKIEVPKEKEAMSVTIKLANDKSKDYYSQRNNVLTPLASCNTTSMTMALYIRNHMFKDPAGLYCEDDYLSSILQSKKYYDIRDNDPELAWASTYAPQEIWKLLAKAINDDVYPNCNYADMIYSAPIQKFLFELIKGNPSVIGGSFTKYGHIVVLSGFETYQENIRTIISAEQIDLTKITEVTIEDPYGNFHKGYNPNIDGGTDGFNCKFSYAEIVSLWMNSGETSKLGIIIR